jgi:hypothetical protein
MPGFFSFLTDDAFFFVVFGYCTENEAVEAAIMSALRSSGGSDPFDVLLPKDGSDGYAPCCSRQMNKATESLWCVLCRKDGNIYAVDGERLHWQSIGSNAKKPVDFGPLAVPTKI